MQHATITDPNSFPDWAQLKVVSEETSSLAPLRDLGALQESLDHITHRGLILYDSPVTTIAQSLERGISTSDALTQWCSEADTVLAVLRSNRRKLVLAERPGGDETLQSLSAFFPKITPADLATKEIVTDPMTVQMAEMLLILDRSAFKIWSELQASSVGHHSADIDPLQSIGGLASEWHTLHQAHNVLLRYQEEIGTALQQQVLQLEDSLKATENARILSVSSNDTQASRISELLTQLQTATTQQAEVGEKLLAVQKEREAQAILLEQLQSELQASKETSEGLQNEREEQSLKLEQLSKDLQAAKSQSEFLGEKLDAEVQRARYSEQKLATSKQSEEHLVTQVRELETCFKAKIDENEHHIQDLQYQLDAVHASNSWRITAPIRAVVLWWRGQND